MSIVERDQVEEGRRRVVIDSIRPCVDAGRWPVKRVIGDRLQVEAVLIADGHELVAGVLRHRDGEEGAWREVPLSPEGNDRYRAEVVLERLGRHAFTVEAWLDLWGTYRRGLGKKHEAGQPVELELREGAALLSAAAARAGRDDDRVRLERAARRLGDTGVPRETRVAEALDEELGAAASRWPDRRQASRREPPLEVIVDPVRARFSSWYEFFPRSTGPAGRHGTLRDAEARLAYAAELGFDVVYLPPIHPIGRRHRKGRNNSVEATAGDPGSPWAIGAAEGGHTAIHPELGTLDDFRRFVARARELGVDVAIDVAFQASPDHPWVTEHPDWFHRRADGSIQYAENPPKKYQDVYPLAFDGPSWRALWDELLGVFLFWAREGVRIFRVDNPHTKPLPFWAWCLPRVKARHPDAIFLAEAFTRPHLKYGLAKLGFSQSYTYFTWRNTREELERYFTELTRTEVAEYFRPNLWPNTPDILPETLQLGGRPAFVTRAVLAATLGASWGIYGPAFELCEHRPLRQGSEEYLDSEKYELKVWDVDRPDSLRHLIRRLNEIRRAEPALQRDDGLRFHATDSDRVICYSKRAPGAATVLVVASLDPHHPRSCFVELDLDALGLAPGEAFQVHDLLGGARYLWQGARNFVELSPDATQAHVFRLRRHQRSEHDFEYYL